MYPLSILTLLVALARDDRVARYFLPLPAVGACVSIYHILVENHVVGQSNACLLSAPGGCGVKWINEFGYVTIPVLALTGFALELAFLALAATNGGVALDDEDGAPEPPDEQPEPRRLEGVSAAVVAVVAVAVAGGAVAVGWAIQHVGSGDGAVTTTTAAPTTTRPPGAVVFDGAGCAGCHTLSAAGASGTSGPDLDAVKSTAARVAAVVRSGKGSMPSYAGRLTAHQIADVAAFVSASAGG
jgi:mono/diheme cytochrome c family protein